MRPQDIVIIIKILIINEKPWQYRDFSAQLHISLSEISASIQRSSLSGLLEGNHQVNRSLFMGFLEWGLPVVFPESPAGLVRGIPTAHSHDYFKGLISGDINYVWESPDGSVSGLALSPLHQGVPLASKADPLLHLTLSSLDILRIGRKKEIPAALGQLKNLVLGSEFA